VEEVGKRGGDRDKGCRCGRTKCLKQYCACFRNDVRCTSDCVCSDCRNDGKHEHDRMMAVRAIRLNSKDAFKGTDLMIDDQTVTTPKGSVKTVRGCRCKRSKCLKKYCECFGVGLKCGDNCICENCHNGNEFGGSSMLKKKSGQKLKASTPKSKGTPPKPQHNKVASTTAPILHKPQFKVQQTTTVAPHLMGHVGKPLQARKPPLSVRIPLPPAHPMPIQRDLTIGDRNTPTNDMSARREVSTAWGMTPLGNCTGVPMGMDRENSGFPLFSAQGSLITPSGGFPRDLSGLPQWHPQQWDNEPSGRSTLRSPGVFGNMGLSLGFAESPKMSMTLMTPRSPLKPLPSATGAAPVTVQSPGTAMFSAAECLLPSPVRRGPSGLSAMPDDMMMGREISARF